MRTGCRRHNHTNRNAHLYRNAGLGICCASLSDALNEQFLQVYLAGTARVAAQAPGSVTESLDRAERHRLWSEKIIEQIVFIAWLAWLRRRDWR